MFRQVFETAACRLSANTIDAVCNFGTAIEPTDIDDFEQAYSVVLPASVRAFYVEIGDGLEFRWFLDRSDAAQPFCWLKVPQLAELKQLLDHCRSLNSSLSDHDFREAQDVEFARAQYARQLGYFPILRCNSDLICIEVTDEKEQVVFHDAEWSFYDHGNSGVILADSLLEFWRGWAKVGFVAPKQFWWPATIGSHGTDWSAERFGFSLR